jgi:hypothetical protein
MTGRPVQPRQNAWTRHGKHRYEDPAAVANAQAAQSRVAAHGTNKHLL